MIPVRPALELDAGSMARLLNDIIAKGGTTALARPVTSADIGQWMAYRPGETAWYVALDEREQVMGFQWIEPHDGLPADACDIATFVQIGRSGLGIGSTLFDATRAAAKALGYRWINASIRSDNEGGLIYYQSRGFRTYGHLHDQRLADGQIVEKTLKRFDLY